MHHQKPGIVWFKRDLRLSDHEPLAAAINSGKPLILLFIRDDFQFKDERFSDRHFRFQNQSLVEMNTRLKTYNSFVYCVSGDALEIFRRLQLETQFDTVWSYAETGVDLTFQRDLKLKKWFVEQQINWTEWPSNSVIRGHNGKKSYWSAKWEAYVRTEIYQPNLNQIKSISIDKSIFSEDTIDLEFTENSELQPGGETYGWKYLNSFLNDRHRQYLC
jgi:deoxyribodipyrimidine photo-lyase